MNNVFKILLAAAAICLLWLCYDSITTPIKFNDQRDYREKEVIARLVEIRKAENEYRIIKGCYAADFDTLMYFLHNEKAQRVLKVGELTDKQLESGLTEKKALKILAAGGKEDKATYIQALIDTREAEDITIFQNCMASLHVQHLKVDIEQYIGSTVEKMVDNQTLKQKMVDNWSIKPTLAVKLVDILEFVADKETFTTEDIVHHFGFTPTTAKRYLRQLTEFGYMEARGGNRNRSYRLVSFS